MNTKEERDKVWRKLNDDRLVAYNKRNALLFDDAINRLADGRSKEQIFDILQQFITKDDLSHTAKFYEPRWIGNDSEGNEIMDRGQSASSPTANNVMRRLYDLLSSEHGYGISANPDAELVKAVDSAELMEKYPRSSALRLDTYFKEPDTIGFYDYDYDDSEGIFNEQFYKNLLKSTNIDKADKEIKTFLSDNKYRFNPTHKGKINSMNSMRNLLQEFQAIDRRNADNKELLDLYHKDEKNKGRQDIYRDTDRGTLYWHKRVPGYSNVFTEDVPEEVLAPYRQQIKDRFTIPYDFGDAPQVLKEGWRLFEDPADQLYDGMGTRRCYGDICTFGLSHAKNYVDKQKGKQVILINNGDVTAEIVLSVDNAGNVINATVNESNVMHPNNIPVKQDSPIRQEVRSIAERLKGKYISDLDAKDVKRCVSDILLKYMPRTNQNIANAIRRRKY